MSDSDNNQQTDPQTPEEPKKSIGVKLYEKLLEYGLPAVLAAALVAAIYGILCALGVIAVSQCTATYTQTADGQIHVQGSVAAPETVTPTK